MASKKIKREGKTIIEWFLDRPAIPVPCENCGKESFGNLCEGDREYHYHGCVHTSHYPGARVS